MSIIPHRAAVGSRNPTKVASVTRVVRRLWPEVEVVAVKVSSGVDIQPTSDEEAIRGARNRAQQALASAGADLGGGTRPTVCSWKDGPWSLTGKGGKG
jgi:non-canonical (house-cleaning) NTP pyrophosphatase